MDENKKTSWEMKIVFYVFLILCAATLADIIPAFDGSSWATKLYGIICLFGVIFCSKNEGMFMAIDAFTSMYPKGLQKVLSKICQILMLVFLVILEIALILSFMDFIGGSISTVDDIFNGILYVLSLIVYPVSFLYLARQLIGKGNKGEG